MQNQSAGPWLGKLGCFRVEQTLLLPSLAGEVWVRANADGYGEHGWF